MGSGADIAGSFGLADTIFARRHAGFRFSGTIGVAGAHVRASPMPWRTNSNATAIQIFFATIGEIATGVDDRVIASPWAENGHQSHRHDRAKPRRATKRTAYGICRLAFHWDLGFWAAIPERLSWTNLGARFSQGAARAQRPTDADLFRYDDCSIVSKAPRTPIPFDMSAKSETPREPVSDLSDGIPTLLQFTQQQLWHHFREKRSVLVKLCVLGAPFNTLAHSLL